MTAINDMESEAGVDVSVWRGKKSNIDVLFSQSGSHKVHAGRKVGKSKGDIQLIDDLSVATESALLDVDLTEESMSVSLLEQNPPSLTSLRSASNAAFSCASMLFEVSMSSLPSCDHA